MIGYGTGTERSEFIKVRCSVCDRLLYRKETWKGHKRSSEHLKNSYPLLVQLISGNLKAEGGEKK